MNGESSQSDKEQRAINLLRGLHKVVLDLSDHFDKPITDENLPRWMALNSAQQAVAKFLESAPLSAELSISLEDQIRAQFGINADDSIIEVLRRRLTVAQSARGSIFTEQQTWAETEKAKADAYEAAAVICEEMSYPPEGRERWANKEEEWAAIKLEDAAKAAEQGIRSFHEASIKELYRMLGVDGSDGEIRFKWAALALSGKLRELEKAKAALAVIRPEGTLITDDEATRILRWHAAGDDAVNLQSPEDRALLEKLRGNR